MEAFVSNNSLISFNNVKSDVLDTNNTGTRVLRPAVLGQPAELVYQVKTSDPMKTLRAQIAGRVISSSALYYSSIEVLTSTDGISYSSAWKITNNTLQAEFAFLTSPKEINLDSKAQGKKEIFIKIILNSAGLDEPNATWGSIDSFKLVSTKEIIVPVSTNGIIFNETFDSINWGAANKNLIDSSNIGGGIPLDTNNQSILIASTTDKTKSGSMTFQIKTNEFMDRMMLEYTGRVISNNPALYSSIKFYVSDNGSDWRTAGEYKGNELSNDFSFLSASNSLDLSEEVYDKKTIYVKVEIFSVSDTWGCLNNLKITTIAKGQSVASGFIPAPIANGVLLNENFENTNWAARTYNVDNIMNGPLDTNYSKKVLSPKPGMGGISAGSVTYAFRTSAPIGPTFIEFSGRAIRGSTLEFMVSGDGIEWESAYIMHSPENGEKMDFYSDFTIGRSIDITTLTKRKTAFFLKIRIESKLETWGSSTLTNGCITECSRTDSDFQVL
jgi:hypothetical protein